MADATASSTAAGAGKCEIAIEKSITDSPWWRRVSTRPCMAVVASGRDWAIRAEIFMLIGCVASQCRVFLYCTKFVNLRRTPDTLECGAGRASAAVADFLLRCFQRNRILAAGVRHAKSYHPHFRSR